MRIGELAALAGVSTRTVRHYHRIGLLPEPDRRSNGYRVYGLRDAVLLVRVRRLTELGLSLDEAADVLADDAGRDLQEVLAELDASLALQEEQLRSRRSQLAALQELAADRLPAEGPVSPELAAVLAEMTRTAGELPGGEPETARRERELLVLLDGSPSGAARGWLTPMTEALRSDPDAVRRAYELYARMDELADAAPDDPRVPEVARAIVDVLPPEVADRLAEELTRAPLDLESENGFTRAFFADQTPAQAEAVRRAIELLRERAR
ncbi:MerR family transcriptional regulator [Streptomyces sp. XM4193]|uniref:MerR family transcriptional regulator n=1 Tax=Streptomyces sp. XM4193 TaxID=2929782 RepID=UPI001FF9058D|nr:MerR family transcriptional regulator [Streptomyces sp. XM4193]MCK1795173.1 MerR family transcriptional regulator [Streptomyces sp. XM4193]